jgi:cytochrome c-type biogenesis protein CcmH/NrfF
VSRRSSAVTLRALLVAAAIASALTLTALAGASAATAAPAAKASLSDVEDEVMCPSCHEPLALAQSPQAIAERNFIRTLIAQGKTKAEIEQALVAQYGTSVLARPPAHGFNLTVYLLPPALLLTGIALLVILLPRWRARSRARAPAEEPRADPTLSAEDARRLEEDLTRYG